MKKRRKGEADRLTCRLKDARMVLKRRKGEKEKIKRKKCRQIEDQRKEEGRQ